MSPPKQTRAFKAYNYLATHSGTQFKRGKRPLLSEFNPNAIAESISFDDLIDFSRQQGFQRQPNRDKRPLNNYMQFQCHLTKYLDRSVVGLQIPRPIPRLILTKVASIIWKGLGSKKSVFQEHAMSCDSDHKDLNPDYRYNPQKQKPTMRLRIQTSARQDEYAETTSESTDSPPSSDNTDFEQQPQGHSVGLYAPVCNYDDYQFQFLVERFD
jgi:hypothetical protein